MTKTTIADLIPSDLKMSTSDRLRLVADIIEAEPKRWFQGSWAKLKDRVFDPSPLDAAATRGCGTSFCMAGWAVSTATEAMTLAAIESRGGRSFSNGTEWERAGAGLLGLDMELARALFMDTARRRWMPGALRTLAELPAPRTLADAHAAGLTKIKASS